MNIKKIIVYCLLLSAYCLVSSVYAQEGGIKIAGDVTGKNLTNQLQGSWGGISVGYVKAGSVEVGSLQWRPDFKYGAWGAGFDLNVPLGSQRPENYDSLVFRYVEYDDSQKGLRYGMLSNLTWGHGLLIKNYSTRVSIPGIPYNNQMGIKGYYNWDIYGVQGFNSWSHVSGVRLTEKVHPLLILGQSYVTDTDGVTVKQPNGTDRLFPSQTGVAVDATVPLPYGFNGYGECAQLGNHGRGASLGVDWGGNISAVNMTAYFDAGYRFVGGGFVPGYFNSEYEFNPTDLGSASATAAPKNGYFAEFKGSMQNLMNLNIIYENYQGSSSSLMAETNAQVREDTTLYAYYKQPNFTDFNSLSFEQGAVIGAKIGYKVNPYTTVITHYRKAYNPTLGKVEETQFYEVALSF